VELAPSQFIFCHETNFMVVSIESFETQETEKITRVLSHWKVIGFTYIQRGTINGNVISSNQSLFQSFYLLNINIPRHVKKLVIRQRMNP
jgi:hypothetical protein